MIRRPESNGHSDQASGIKWSSTRFSAGSCVVFDLYDLEEGITNFILKFADDTKVFGKVMDEKDKVCCKQI